jgi:hypothetical protein
MKQLCQENNLWLHVIGDLLGSLTLLSTIKENVNINCDSLTIDIVKLLGIQNLPYLTFLLRSIPEITTEIQDERLNNNNNNPFYDIILHSPSINFLSIWSISQRCSKSNVLYHMKCSFDLSNTLMKRLKQIKTIKILNDENDQQSSFTYKRICEGDASDEQLPKTIVLFRFETTDVPEVSLYQFFDLRFFIDLFRLKLYLISMVILIYLIFGYSINYHNNIRK